MRFIKSHFALSKAQQNGIFVLIGVIIILQLFIWFGDRLFRDTSEGIINLQTDEWQKALDSLNHERPSKPDTIYPFNPNYLTDFKGYRIGMSVEEIDRLLDHRKAGKWINSPEDFKSITGITDSLFLRIAPSLRFPAWVRKKESKVRVFPASVPIIKADLNSASAEDLQKVNGIGEVLSNRIIKYRFKIGGFIDQGQLNDVYGLTPEVIDLIFERFEIQSRPVIERKNLNTISLKELSEIPYLDYDLARKIINYRALHEKIENFEELSGILGFSSDKIDKIKLYLAIN